MRCSTAALVCPLVFPLMTATAAPLNHLAHEKSPYLQQHATNPVDWYPWGPEAFAKARAENKPIFLSIGYSTCHWCHVMERESFTNKEIAAVMNANFVSIKVDREERPDVDGVYMAFVQATTGSGGWPMSVWLTPDLEPFVGGTYFPPADAGGRPGFKSVLGQIAAAWKSDEKNIRAAAGETTAKLRAITKAAPIADAGLPGVAASQKAFADLAASYDANLGGFGAAPKFPRPVIFRFLDAVANDPDFPAADREKAVAMSSETLRKMAAGGIHDQLGGGFHRYSTDEFWRIPHYEKMLYDQAQIVTSSLDAARHPGGESHLDTVRDILAYVGRRMTSPGGGFYSAEDADSLKSSDSPHKTEGAFYVWEKSEIDRLLGDAAPAFEFAYGVTAAGNAPAGSEIAGTNTLIRAHSEAETAAKFHLPEAAVADSLAKSRTILLAAREQRPRPHLDDKILTAWNGLMISAFARASQDLDDPAYLESATKAARFVKSHLYDAGRGALLRSYRGGPAPIDGFAADYAFLIQGLLDLYQAGLDPEWLRWADELQTKQDELFADAKGGGYFASAAGDKHVLMRQKESYDGAEPSENSVSALNLIRLAAMLDQPARRERAEGIFRAFSGQISASPTAAPLLLAALETFRTKPSQVVIAGDPGAADTQALLKITRAHPRAGRILLLADGAAGQDFLASRAPFYRSLVPIEGKAAAYVCEDFVCQLPTTDPAVLTKALATP